MSGDIGKSSLTGMLVALRRRTNRDNSALTGVGRPTQLGLGDAGLASGLDAVRFDLQRAFAALAIWLDHVRREPRPCG